MPLYGYARVSTLDQDLTIQQAALKAAGCDVIRAEKASGTRRDGRSELQVLLDFVHAGDTLVVTRIDRLARSLKDLQDIVHELKAKGVALKATEQPVDTGFGYWVQGSAATDLSHPRIAALFEAWAQRLDAAINELGLSEFVTLLHGWAVWMH